MRGRAFFETFVWAKQFLKCSSFKSFREMNGVVPVPKTVVSKKKETNGFGKDRRRRHHHFLVTVFYADGEKFGRVYTDKMKATRFAERQRRSPVVKSVRVSQVS